MEVATQGCTAKMVWKMMFPIHGDVFSSFFVVAENIYYPQ